jgi:hypothetical protein
MAMMGCWIAASDGPTCSFALWRFPLLDCFVPQSGESRACITLSILDSRQMNFVLRLNDYLL